MFLLSSEGALDCTARLTSVSCAGGAYTSLSDPGGGTRRGAQHAAAMLWCGPVPALALLLLLPKLL